MQSDYNVCQWSVYVFTEEDGAPQTLNLHKKFTKLIFSFQICSSWDRMEQPVPGAENKQIQASTQEMFPFNTEHTSLCQCTHLANTQSMVWKKQTCPRRSSWKKVRCQNAQISYCQDEEDVTAHECLSRILIFFMDLMPSQKIRSIPFFIRLFQCVTV